MREGMTPVLEFSGISKRFGNTQALDHVSFALQKGEVRGLAGENGAGKSTLIKILSGVHGADSGKIWFDGQEIRPRTPGEAEELGIRVFHQEIPLCLNLSVAANVFLAPKLPSRWGMPDWPSMIRRCEELFETLGERIDPRQLVLHCTAAEKQLVLLARVLSQQARLIVLDEPTTALTPPDIDRLFGVINRLKGEGITFLFVSHMLEEIMRLADRITVLRNGGYVGTLERPEFSPQRLSQMIVGREVVERMNRQAAKQADVPVLQAQGISARNRFEDVSFAIARGEIVGITGLQGSGHSALVRSLFGSPPLDSGQLWINGEKASIRSPQDAMRHEIGYVPEDRKLLGLFFALDIKKNLGLAKLGELAPHGLIAENQLRALAQRMAGQLHIVMSSVNAPMTSLSGGNQQKVLIGRWLALQPRLLIMHEPTRGVDIGSKEEIRRLTVQLADEGYAFLVASSDIDELLAISDRVLVMYRGRLVAEYAHSEATKQKVILAATTSSEG